MGRHHLAHGQGAGDATLVLNSVSCSTSKLCEAVGVQRQREPGGHGGGGDGGLERCLLERAVAADDLMH